MSGTMQNQELIELLHQQATEIAKEGHNGWGNTMSVAAAAITKAGLDDLNREPPMTESISTNFAWVQGLIPGQPHWVWELVASELDRRENSTMQLRAEIERLRTEVEDLKKRLMIAWNFPVHPGCHPADLSGDAMSEDDWRHGWITAVSTLQDALRRESD